MPRRSPDQPLPLEALRDLIGICRALYASLRAEGASESKLEHLCYIGAMLREAHHLGRGAHPHTKRFATAWAKAEEGAAALGFFIAPDVPLRPSIEAAAKRVTGELLPDDKLQMRRKRG